MISCLGALVYTACFQRLDSTQSCFYCNYFVTYGDKKISVILSQAVPLDLALSLYVILRHGAGLLFKASNPRATVKAGGLIFVQSRPVKSWLN